MTPKWTWDVQAQTDGLGLVEEAAHAEGIMEHDASRIPEAAAPADLPPRAYIRAPRVIEGAEAPPAARAVIKVPVLPDVSVAHGAYGDIRYNPLSESFIAVCKQAHGDCRRSRTCKAAKTLHTDRLAAQGRPIGLLAAWLETGALHTTDEAHKKAITGITREQRVRARAAFQAHANAEEVLVFERPLRAAEPEEPTSAP